MRDPMGTFHKLVASKIHLSISSFVAPFIFSHSLPESDFISEIFSRNMSRRIQFLTVLQLLPYFKFALKI